VELDYSAMPGISASLVTLAFDGDQEGQGWHLSTATRSDGTTSVSFFISSQETGELALYDLAGRKVITLWEGSGNALAFSADIVKGDFPAGLYFVTLTGESTMLAGKCFLW
ncbi:MAG: T9SS type A sorting domain-containing protein, partial [Candidatus Sabulitectum sp.]|nr:T9SS type A sorting domain-containing protein [Candidatus Sabulitectum sp.]